MFRYKNKIIAWMMAVLLVLVSLGSVSFSTKVSKVSGSFACTTTVAKADSKAKVVEAYEAENPTAENTVEIVKELAEVFEKTPNGIRMILTKAGVYVKKAAATAAASATSTGSKRVNKAEAISEFKKAIKAAGKEVDDDIVDRLTGKAAVYLKGLIA